MLNRTMDTDIAAALLRRAVSDHCCHPDVQVVQTRILSVMAWYHLAFFAISMAMFGLTAGAVWLYLRRDRFTEKTLSYDLSYYSTAYAIAIGLSLIVQMTSVPGCVLP